MTMPVLVLLHFVLLHTLDGRDIYLNPGFVVSASEAREEDDPKKLMTAKVHCLISLLDGKFITVEEDCDSVRRRLQDQP
jgi:uncharacterized protein YlzI (FlbEa/FlbD family)